MTNQPSPLRWAHTWPERGQDYGAILASGTFGRIHRQAGRPDPRGEWVWSLTYPAATGLLKTGHVSTRDEAVEAVRQGHDEALRWHAERDMPLILWLHATEGELRADPTLGARDVVLMVGRDVPSPEGWR